MNGAIFKAFVNHVTRSNLSPMAVDNDAHMASEIDLHGAKIDIDIIEHEFFYKF
jgi:hypothetical protein